MKKKVLLIFILLFFILSAKTVYADSTVSVVENSVYKITGETVNEIPRYIADFERTGVAHQGENKNLTIFNKIIPFYINRRWFYWKNSTGDWTNRKLPKKASSQLVEQGPLRIVAHFENTSSSYGNSADCWTDACWNFSVDVYAYPKYYLQLNRIWGNFTAAQLTVGYDNWMLPYAISPDGGNVSLWDVAVYFKNGTYKLANNTFDIEVLGGRYNESIMFLYNESGHNKTYAIFPTYTNLGDVPEYSWYKSLNGYLFPSLYGGMNPSPYIFGYGYFFADSGNKSLAVNETVWNEGFKDQWNDIYYPASISVINGTYQQRDNITGTYNFTVDSNGLLRFNFSTGNYDRSYSVFNIKDTISAASSYKDHIWYKNYSQSTVWQKLNNYTDFIIQDGNSTYFGYNYILLLINKTLGSDYEFWVDDNEDPAGKTVSINLNITKTWWNEQVLAYGKVLLGLNPIGGETVTVKINTETKCSTQTNSSGDYECSFYAPNELGSYNVKAEASGAEASTTLEVKPSYGERPIGTIDRVVYEIPVLIQELSGRIRRIFARVIVWRG